MKKTICKKLTILLSTLTLCCSAVSYTGDDKTQDAMPLKPYFYIGANEDEAIRFEQSILQNSPAFAVALALKIHAPDIYCVLQDTKTYMFQKNQIALMQDVLEELKAVNQNWMQQHRDWALQTYAPAVFEVTAKLTKLAEETSFHAGKTVANDSKSKGDTLVRFREVAEGFNNKQPADNDRDNILRLTVGSVTPKSRIGEAIADYFTNQMAKQNALFAKHGITELPMQPQLKVINWSKMPDIKAGCGSPELVNPPNFQFVSGYALALAQEIFNRPSFQKDISALIQQTIAKALPAYAEQSKNSDDNSAIDLINLLNELQNNYMD